MPREGIGIMELMVSSCKKEVVPSSDERANLQYHLQQFSSHGLKPGPCGRQDKGAERGCVMDHSPVPWSSNPGFFAT